jgi:excisionase family DNA binding protein
VTSFLLENVSVPPEVEQAVDKRSSMSVIGNLNDYVKYQMGVAMGQGGEAGAAATMPAQMAMGFGMAQEMMRSMQSGTPAGGAPAMGGSPDAATMQVLTPEQAAQVLAVPVADVMAAIEAGDLKARKIGASYRIARSALEAFLGG